VDTVRAFRQRHRIEQCVSVWLTDGEDTDGLPVEAGNVDGPTRSSRADVETVRRQLGGKQQPLQPVMARRADVQQPEVRRARRAPIDRTPIDLDHAVPMDGVERGQCGHQIRRVAADAAAPLARQTAIDFDVYWTWPLR